MLITITGAKCVGIDAVPVSVEVKIDRGIGIHLVGLADAAVKESLLRTVTALQSMGFHIPGKKIVINLAPADLHKSGSGYDLPIALGIIAASEQRNLLALSKYLIMGELGLDGSVRPVPGALPFAEMAIAKGLAGCILPTRSALEAVEYRQSAIFGVDTLSDVLRILEEREDNSRLLIWNKPAYHEALEAAGHDTAGDYPDFADIIGQEGAKRGAEIAVSGGHNLILVGSPGSGKSTLAKAMAGILPPMTLEESIVTSKIYSISGVPRSGYGLMKKRPFRAPHYSASLPAIIGGGNGNSVMPGEVSLANGGVLFLDEFAQIPKSVVEALRGPLEDRKVAVSRLRTKTEYPCSFMLVAASNPCPCGYYGEGDRCTCTVGRRMSYLSRLSGPIMDRLDLHVWMSPVDTGRLVRRVKGESSAEVAKRVLAARKIQEYRFRDEGISVNAEMDSRMLERFCPLDDNCNSMMEKLICARGLSARAFTRILKVARTIADLDAVVSAPAGEEPVPGPLSPEHLAEAATYRFLDRRNLEEIL